MATRNIEKLFQTVEEVRDAVECSVTGTIPDWLSGSILRNGPGKFEVGDTKYNHWFDGLAYFQKFDIQNGKVSYSGKFLQSSTFKRNTAANRIVVSEFGTVRHADPCKTLFSRYFSYFFDASKTDNDVVNFMVLGDQIYSSTELPVYHRIDPVTLESVEKKVSLTQLSRCNGCRNETPCFLPTSTVLECQKTTRWSLKVRLQSTLKKALLPSIFGAIADCLEWDVNLETKLLLAPVASTGKPISRQYFAEPVFTFHHVNSYEVHEANRTFLVVDYCGYDNGLLVTKLNLEAIRSDVFSKLGDEFRSFLKRLVIPLDVPEDAKPGDDLLAGFSTVTGCKATLRADGSVFCTQETLIATVPMELPRINYEMSNSKPYRFCYGSSLGFPVKQGITKADVKTKTFVSWDKDSDYEMPTEPIFIGKPGAVEEDDGVVVTPVLTSKEGDRPFLLILDGKTFKELARAYIPVDIPHAFHEIFIENK